jgi:preprotein translocase subunit SecE
MERNAARRPISISRPRRLFRIRYIEEIWGELKKVSWPDRETAWRLTTMVIIIAVAVGLVLGLFDFGFTALIENLFLRR